jgi:hypothetical protein
VPWKFPSIGLKRTSIPGNQNQLSAFRDRLCRLWRRVLTVAVRGGEKPPSGILGEAIETSASFEARSAPLPYPTVKRARMDPYWRAISDGSSLPRRYPGQDGSPGMKSGISPTTGGGSASVLPSAR